MNRRDEIRTSRRKVRPFIHLRTGPVLLCLIPIVGWLGVVASKPFLQAHRMRLENAQLERRIQTLQEETNTLRKTVGSLRTDQGREREARHLGYVRSGEIRLVVPE